jgi:hypothetical protein
VTPAARGVPAGRSVPTDPATTPARALLTPAPALGWTIRAGATAPCPAGRGPPRVPGNSPARPAVPRDNPVSRDRGGSQDHGVSRNYGGGADGNERLTAATGAVLLALFAAEGFTILSIHQLITLHFFLGMHLAGPWAGFHHSG